MSLEATKMWSRHDASFDTDDGRKFKGSIREGYQVVTEADDVLGDVLSAAGLPNLRDLYPGTAALRAKSIKPVRTSPVLWTLEVVYEGNFGPNGMATTPLDEPPVVSWSKVETEEAIDEDLNGKPIVTKAGEPIDGITKKISDLVVTIKRNYAGINLPATYQYLHSVNSDVFLGFAPGLGRMTQFSANEKYDVASGGYYEVSAAIQFRYPYRTTPDKAWWTRVRHEGYYFLNADGEPERAPDDKGEPSSRPVLLTRTGQLEKNPDNATWLEFQIYQPLPYRSLGLV